MPTPENQDASMNRTALELAQWSEWKATRRRLLKAGVFASSAMAFAGFGGARYFAPSASAQDTEPVPGGVLSMTLADDDIQSFDPIIVSDNMSIWTQLLVYDQLIRVAAVISYVLINDAVVLRPAPSTESEFDTGGNIVPEAAGAD